MIKWIDKLFCSECKFWGCFCCKRAKVQLFKETWISRRKCCFDFSLIFRYAAMDFANKNKLKRPLSMSIKIKYGKSTWLCQVSKKYPWYYRREGKNINYVIYKTREIFSKRLASFHLWLPMLFWHLYSF